MVIPPLKRIMHFLSGGEEVGRAGDDPPFCLDAQAVHQKGKRGEYFRHSPAVESRIDVRNVQITQPVGLAYDSVDGFPADQRLVIINPGDVREIFHRGLNWYRRRYNRGLSGY